MSNRAPTSTPCVGSSARMTLTAPRRNGRASETFCWLPPESEPTGCSIEAMRMRSRSPSACTAVRSRPRWRKPRRRREGRIWIVAFARTLRTGKSDSRARSPESNTTPARIGPSGLRRSSSLPSQTTEPVARSTPARARRNCTCPLPSAPATPTISPFRTIRSTGPKRSPSRPDTARSTSPSPPRPASAGTRAPVDARSSARPARPRTSPRPRGCPGRPRRGAP